MLSNYFKIAIRPYASIYALSGFMAIAVALFTVSFQSIKAALMNPVRSLRSE
jgi:putative ABC transport system permease protein